MPRIPVSSGLTLVLMYMPWAPQTAYRNHGGPTAFLAEALGETEPIAASGQPTPLADLAAHPLITLGAGTTSHDFYAELFLRHGLSFSPDVEVETTAQVPPVVQSDLGVGFVPRNRLLRVLFSTAACLVCLALSTTLIAQHWIAP